MAEKAALVDAMREAARWRRAKAQESTSDKIARHRSNRAMVAIQIAAKFVEELPDDDRDLRWLRHIEVDRERLTLCEESLTLLNRFGMDRGAWQEGAPGETQIRNLLRRMDGAESRKRAAQRRDAL